MCRRCNVVSVGGCITGTVGATTFAAQSAVGPLRSASEAPGAGSDAGANTHGLRRECRSIRTAALRGTRGG